MLLVTSLYEQVAPLVVTLGRGSRRGCGLVVAQDRVAVLTRSLARDQLELGLGGAAHEALLVGHDARSGVSLLEAPTGDVEPAPWAAGRPGIGEQVLALGDPGSGLRATAGHVSAGPIEIRSRAGRALEAIEHTAPLPRGTAGGPLLDERGAVAGINVLRGDPGFVIALASGVVQPAVERLLSGARQPPRLGVAVAPPYVGRRLRRAVGLDDVEGLLVREVEHGSPAEIAGLRAGDLMLALAGAELRSLEDLHAALDTAGPRKQVLVVRGNDRLELSVELAGDQP